MKGPKYFLNAGASPLDDWGHYYP